MPTFRRIHPHSGVSPPFTQNTRVHGANIVVNWHKTRAYKALFSAGFDFITFRFCK